MNDLQTSNIQDIREMAANLSELPINGRGSYIGDNRTCKLKALLWWVHDCNTLGVIPNPYSFEVSLMNICIQWADIAREVSGNKDIKPPRKFKVPKWEE